MEVALLGVLALLLGFTMFEARKQLVLNEANAIGTSCLRARLLPAPEGPEIASLLGQYINVRVQYGTSGDDLAPLDDLHAQAAHLQTELWTRAAAFAQKDPNPVTAALLL